MSDFIKVLVKPSSKEQKITYDKDKDAYIIHLKSPAQDNKANIELIKLLRKQTGKIPSIKSGKTSKNKLVRLD